MTNTATMIINNLLGLVDVYGFVPNGSRQYYLNRSQPPLLILMVEVLFEVTHDIQWLKSILPLLEKEYKYWMQSDTHLISLVDSQGVIHNLNRYYASTTHPRPEAFLEDCETARIYVQNTNKTSSAKVAAPLASYLYSQLAASAETGWDFSSRWFYDRKNLSTAQTTSILPIDLNAIMWHNEMALARLIRAIVKSSTNNIENVAMEIKAVHYTGAATRRLLAISTFMWDDHSYQWKDYNFERKLREDENVLSNFLPLFFKCFDPQQIDVGRVIQSLLKSGLVLPGGLVASLDQDGQQWDYPNAWVEYSIAKQIKMQRLEMPFISIQTLHVFSALTFQLFFFVSISPLYNI